MSQDAYTHSQEQHSSHVVSYSYRTYSYSKFSPTLYHNLVHLSGTTRRRREPISSINEVNHLTVCLALKWFVSQTPYLIHEYTKAPNITGCGVLLVVKCLNVVVVACEQTIVHTIIFIYMYLKSCPLHRNLSSLRHIVVTIK